MQTNKEEVTLDEIYDVLKDHYPAELCKKIKEQEIETEFDLCYRNEHIGEIFNWCIRNQKRIIITTDMYLPIEVIKSILNNHGYSNYEKIIISSEWRALKSSGRLWDVVISEYGKKNNIIHIGDSIIGDYIWARKKGIRAFLIKR